MTHDDLDDLDGVDAAPGNHVVLFENDRVRVLRTTIPVGTVTLLHTHHADAAVRAVGIFIRRETARRCSTREPTRTSSSRRSSSPSIPRHTIENTGDDDLVVIGVLKSAPGD
jgi:hypothetical protein